MHTIVQLSYLANISLWWCSQRHFRQSMTVHQSLHQIRDTASPCGFSKLVVVNVSTSWNAITNYLHCTHEFYVRVVSFSALHTIFFQKLPLRAKWLTITSTTWCLIWNVCSNCLSGEHWLQHIDSHIYLCPLSLIGGRQALLTTALSCKGREVVLFNCLHDHLMNDIIQIEVFSINGCTMTANPTRIWRSGNIPDIIGKVPSGSYPILINNVAVKQETEVMMEWFVVRSQELFYNVIM